MNGDSKVPEKLEGNCHNYTKSGNKIEERRERNILIMSVNKSADKAYHKLTDLATASLCV